MKLKFWATLSLLVNPLGFLFALESKTISLSTPAQITLFFDLGNTLINTDGMSKPGEIPVRKTVHWIQSAKTFVKKVQANYVKLGIITNVPKTWSVSDLKNFVGERWQDDEAFAWTAFENRIQMPTQTIPAKPSPEIFKAAQQLSPSKYYVFVGENERELNVACSLGFHSYKLRPESQEENGPAAANFNQAVSSHVVTQINALGADDYLQPFCAPEPISNPLWTHVNLRSQLWLHF